jgi:hypothetical protein
MNMHVRAERLRAVRNDNRPHLRLVGGRGDEGTTAHGFRLALRALGAAYSRVAIALNERLERPNVRLSELSELGAQYSWISERRRLVQTFLDSEPTIMAYARCDCRNPDQIRSLAEAATELADDSRSLSSALGLLSYIDHELGWSGSEEEPLVAV